MVVVSYEGFVVAVGPAHTAAGKQLISADHTQPLARLEWYMSCHVNTHWSRCDFNNAIQATTRHDTTATPKGRK